MMIYKCWTEGWNGKYHPEAVEASKPKEAARRFAEDMFYLHEPYQFLEVFVKDESDKEFRYEIEVESEPVFHVMEI